MQATIDTFTTVPPGPRAPSRRSLFGAGAALLAGGAAIARGSPKGPRDPDAKLLALCVEFHRRHAEVVAADAAADGTTANSDDLYDACDALFDAQDRRRDIECLIEHMPPLTQAGRAAKAAIAVVLVGEDKNLSMMDWSICFALSALIDVARGAVA